MNGIIYKSLLLLDRGQDRKAIETLENLVKNEHDICNLVTARCILGEYYSRVCQETAKKHFAWIVEETERVECDDDMSDLLCQIDFEVKTAKQRLTELTK